MNARTSLRRRALVTSFLVLPCLVAAVVAGCGDDDTTSQNPVVSPDSGLDGNMAKDSNNVVDNFVPGDTGPIDAAPGVDSGDSGPTDAGVDAAALAALQARGKYIVEAVVGCGDCHTPRGAGGAPIADKLLSGVDCFIATSGSDAGCLNSANLTNDPTGLANRTDEEIKTMFMTGKRPNGSFLNNVMPYYTLHNLKADDADAIVAYLRTVPAVSHTSSANQPPFANVPFASPNFDQTKLPVSTDAGSGVTADVANGRYLAQFACLECHTKHAPPGSDGGVIDVTKLFAGNESFPAAALGLPSPPFPETIYSANITPHATGLAGWKMTEIKKAMQLGLDRADGGVCPPMPAGPGGFGKLTEQDAVDIATYINGLPAIDNAIDGGSGSCVAP